MKPPPTDFEEPTAAEAATYLGISRPTLYRRIAGGIVPPATRRIAGKRWFKFELDEAQRLVGKKPARRKRRRAVAAK